MAGQEGSEPRSVRYSSRVEVKVSGRTGREARPHGGRIHGAVRTPRHEDKQVPVYPLSDQRPPHQGSERARARGSAFGAELHAKRALSRVMAAVGVIQATSVALQGSGRGLVRAMGRDRKHATNQTRGSGGTGHYPTCGRNGRRHLLKPATRCCADMPSLGRVLPSHEAGARGDVKATGDSCLGYQTGRGPLGRRLAELAPGRIALLAGPRQVGETTLLLESAEQACERAVYAAADPPEAESPGFWERVVGRAEAAAAAHGRAILLLDEAHLVHGWAAHPKGACDRFRRSEDAVHTSRRPVRAGCASRRPLARASPVDSSG